MNTKLKIVVIALAIESVLPFTSSAFNLFGKKSAPPASAAGPTTLTPGALPTKRLPTPPFDKDSLLQGNKGIQLHRLVQAALENPLDQTNCGAYKEVGFVDMDRTKIEGLPNSNRYMKLMVRVQTNGLEKGAPLSKAPNKQVILVHGKTGIQPTGQTVILNETTVLLSARGKFLGGTVRGPNFLKSLEFLKAPEGATTFSLTPDMLIENAALKAHLVAFAAEVVSKFVPIFSRAGRR